MTPRGSLGGGPWGRSGAQRAHIKFEMPVGHLCGDVEVAVSWGEVGQRYTLGGCPWEVECVSLGGP